MELTNQDKEIGASATLGYKLFTSTVGEKREATARFHEVFNNTSQTLDQQHLYNPSPLSSKESSPPQQSHNPRRDPDLVTVPVATTSLVTAAAICVSNSRASASTRQQTAAGTTLIPRNTTIDCIKPSIRYRECLKNHAASSGGHVVDGCGEFMPSGEEGTPESIKCAACQCHRNFHRKEIEGEPQYVSSCCYVPYKSDNPRDGLLSHRPSHNLLPQFPPASEPHQQRQRFFHGPPPMMMTFGAKGGGAAAESSSEDLNMFFSDGGRQPLVQPSLSKKRFRTKFTQQQKDKMMEFAEKLGWRIQKNDEQELQQFCVEVGVKKKVFKVWMHNNKQAMKKKQM